MKYIIYTLYTYMEWSMAHSLSESLFLWLAHSNAK